MKFIKITTEQASYILPLEFVAEHRAFYYEAEDGSDFKEEVEFIMNDNFEGIDWLKNNMNYQDFKDMLVKVKDSSVEEDWANAEMEIVTS